MPANRTVALRVVLRGLSCCLCCAAVLRAEGPAAAVVYPNRPGVADAPAAGPALVLTDPASPLDLGEVLEAEVVREVRLQVLNHSDKPIRVIRVRSTCPCTVTKEVSAEPIPAGGATAVGFQLLVDRLHDGEFRRFVLIELGDAPQPLLKFEFHGIKVPAVLITPERSLGLPAGLNPNAKWTQTFQIAANAKDQALRLGPPVTSPKLKAELKEVSPSHYEVNVESVPALFRGRIAEQIEIPVLEPAKHAPLVLRVHGQVGSALTVVPRLLVLPPRPTGAGEPVTAKVTVYSPMPKPAPRGVARRGRLPVDLKELTIHAPDGVVATPSLSDGHSVISFTFPATVLGKLTRGQIDLETTSGAAGTITFFVGEAPAADADTDAGEGQQEDETPVRIPAADLPAAQAPKP